MNRVNQFSASNNFSLKAEQPSGKLGQRQVEQKASSNKETILKASLACLAVLFLLTGYTFNNQGQVPNPNPPPPPQDPAKPVDSCVANLKELRDEHARTAPGRPPLFAFKISDKDFCSKDLAEQSQIVKESFEDWVNKLGSLKADCIDLNDENYCPVPTRICLDPDVDQCKLGDEETEKVKSFIGEDSLPKDPIKVLDCRPVNLYVKHLLKDECPDYNLMVKSFHNFPS